MTLPEAKAAALHLMACHGLIEKGWRFGFDNARRRFGCVHWKRQTITLSLPLTKLNSDDKVSDTILHEIAHALVGKGVGHGPLWRAKALSIGCNGARCFGPEVATPQKNWQAICAKCGELPALQRFRRLTNAIHKKCSSTLSWRQLSGRPTREKKENANMEAIKAKIGERYLNNKGTPVTIVGHEGDKVLVKIAGSDNEIPVSKSYELKPFSQSGVSREAKLLARTNGKEKNGHAPKEGSLAALIDPFLFEGKHSVRQIAELVTKKAGKLAAHVDMRANVRARLWLYKKKNYAVQRDEKRRVRLVKKS